MHTIVESRDGRRPALTVGPPTTPVRIRGFSSAEWTVRNRHVRGHGAGADVNSGTQSEDRRHPRAGSFLRFGGL